MTYKHLKLWTMPRNYAGEVWPAHYVVMGQHRDSDALTRSNFTALLALLGGESETVTVVREQHWAVGWVEWIGIHQDDETACLAADAALERLDNYPVLDEDAFSELEWNEAAEYWDSLSPREKVQMAVDYRKRYHWLADTPVWRFGRLDYGELVNDASDIATAIQESLRG
jgi:hypothetical protein